MLYECAEPGTLEATVENPYAERRSVELDGYRVRYWFYDADRQRKPLLVMLHGFRGDHHGLQLIKGAKVTRRAGAIPPFPFRSVRAAA